jgi:DNA replication protein DnaC
VITMNGVARLQTCGRCENGFVVDERGRTARPCPCRADAVRRRGVRAMARLVPARYIGVAPDQNPIVGLDERIRARVVAYAREIRQRTAQGKGLWLGGPRGTGKTACAAYIALEAHRRGLEAGFHVLSELLAELRATYGEHRPDVEEHELVDELTALDLLVIDDMGAVHGTPWALDRLFDIVNRRYNAERSIVVTTDLERHQLARVVGWRVVSRLAEITGEPVRFDGADLRQPAI